MPGALTYEWECNVETPFEELIVSWNAKRPAKGHYDFFASALVSNEWTSKILFAAWGCDLQRGGKASDPHGIITADQDTVTINGGRKATAFRLKIEAIDGASLAHFHALYACTSAGNIDEVEHQDTNFNDVNLEVQALSQQTLPHPNHMHMCSATSTAAAISFLINKRLDPVSVAFKAQDQKHEIFGHWTFMTAHAWELLGQEWETRAARLSGFSEIHHRLTLGYPVVTSVRGPLPGSAAPYAAGHLVVVKGYDSINRQVLCMDPAFPEDKNSVRYALKDFLDAWNRRGNIAYLFEKVNPLK